MRAGGPPRSRWIARRGRSAGGGRRRSTPGRRLLGWALVAGLGLVLAGCAIGADTPGEYAQDALNPAGPVARSQDRLWNWVFLIAIGVFVLVQGALIYCVVRYRARPTDAQPPRQVAGNTRLELIWTAIPALVLLGVAVPTLATIFELAEDPGEEALQVRVIGKQFWWEFEYLGDEGQGVVTANELHIPVDRPVRLHMEALNPQAPDTFDAAEPDAARTAAELDGVIHSFWVPELAGKQDVVPGHVREMTIQADEARTYLGQCAHFCGIGHAEMKFRVIAEEPDAFQQWLDEQAQPAETGLEGLAAEGEEIFGVQCITCHAINGREDDQNIRIGPNLTHFASRRTFAGAIFDNDDAEQLAAWLRDPQAVKQGAQMPNLGLDEAQIEALVAYLQSLE